MLHSRLSSLAYNLEALSRRRGCCLNLTHYPTERRRPHWGLSPGGGPSLRWPSSNSNTGEMVVSFGYIYKNILKKQWIILPGKLSVNQYHLLRITACISQQGLRLTILRDLKFSLDISITWVRPSGIMSVCYLCVMEWVWLCELSVPLLLSNWISIEKLCWTYKRAKWGTTHLRISSCHMWPWSPQVLALLLVSEAVITIKIND